MRTMGDQSTTFDFQFSLEFAMRNMGHQNTTFNFPFFFEFVWERWAIGSEFSQEIPWEGKVKVKRKPIFES